MGRQDAVLWLVQAVAAEGRLYGADGRQQNAGGPLMAVLQQANQIISAKLGIDFASNAAPRGGGCCG